MWINSFGKHTFIIFFYSFNNVEKVEFLGLKETEILGVKDKNLLAKYSNYYHYLFLVLMILSFSHFITAFVLFFFGVEDYSLLAIKIGALLLGLFLFVFLLVLFIFNYKAVKQVKDSFSNKDYSSLIALLSTKDNKQKSEFMSLYAALV